MDIGTGKIYPDRETAEQELRKQGVPDKEIQTRLVTGPPIALRKLRKLIKQQWKREHQ